MLRSAWVTPFCHANFRVSIATSPPDSIVSICLLTSYSALPARHQVFVVARFKTSFVLLLVSKKQLRIPRTETERRVLLLQGKRSGCSRGSGTMSLLTRTYGFLQMPGAVYVLDLHACSQRIAARSPHRYIGVDPQRPLIRHGDKCSGAFHPQNTGCWHACFDAKSFSPEEKKKTSRTTRKGQPKRRKGYAWSFLGLRATSRLDAHAQNDARKVKQTSAICPVQVPISCSNACSFRTKSAASSALLHRYRKVRLRFA